MPSGLIAEKSRVAATPYPAYACYYDPMYGYHFAGRTKKLPSGLIAEKSRVAATPYPAYACYYDPMYG
ncbi:hypothetical protein, partial [Enterobacter hormaechei]|uniref:hypothetical protein n=1 Tax=Enterobacter hormaechei TaxID=158836 RepID=UPI0022400D27